MIKARLIQSPDNADHLIAYCARVSNPANQADTDTEERLLRYCARHGHWSVFEMVSVTIGIECPRDIARQMLRHRSFHFQEFSQRYAVPADWCRRGLRMQHPSNRQLSVQCDDVTLSDEWNRDIAYLLAHVENLRDKWLAAGAAKEVVRVIYPEGLTMSSMYVSGTVRDWWHYCRVRRGNGTQREHVELAEAVSDVMQQAVPMTWAALELEAGNGVTSKSRGGDEVNGATSKNADG
jgi:thymidylate synthase (FAD)